MTVYDVYRLIDGRFPFDSAAEYDNVGLLVGDMNATVKRALVTLDCTKAAAEKAAKERAEAVETSKRLRDMILVVNAKGGGAGRLFGSVTNQEIADALKAKTGIVLDKRKIVIADPIKNVGTYTVTCKLGYEISAPLTVKIEEA